MSQENNQGVLIGKVFSTNFQYQTNGACKGSIIVEYVRSWNGKSGPESRTDFIPIGFYGKPAEWAEQKGIRKGDNVKIIYTLGSSPKKEKVDEWWTNVNGYLVDLVGGSPQAPEPPSQLKPKDDDIPF